jgi:hypothetical protein
MSKTYLFSVIVGFILFVIVYYYWNRKTVESFTDISSSDSTPDVSGASSSSLNITMDEAQSLINGLQSIFSSVTSSSPTTTIRYSEDVNRIPNKENLVYYLSSFSDFTSYSSSQPNYVMDTQKWHNHIKNITPFTIVSSSGSLPSSIKPPIGLQIKQITLQGPSADSLDNTDYELSSFTFSFYTNILSLTLTPDEFIELLNVSMEAPNYLKVSVIQDPTISLNVQMVIILGTDSNRYIISIPKSTLISNGSNVLISISYNKTETPVPKIYIYIGTVAPFSASVSSPPTLKLGNTDIIINRYRTWDAKLFAFMYFKNAITTTIQNNLVEYFSRQIAGLDVIVQSINSLAANQIQQINNILSGQSTSIQNITAELEQCRIIEKQYRDKEEKKEAEKWLIKMDGYTAVSNDDIQKCLILRIPNPYTTSTGNVGSGASTSTGNVGTGTSTSTGNVGTGFQINTPINLPNPDTVLTDFGNSIVNYFK